MNVIYGNSIVPISRIIVLLALLFGAHTVSAATDPLPSWNEGTPKESIISFVTAVSDKNHPDYKPPAARIAVFDNDGTLWSEQPVYFQFLFVIDKIKELAVEHPEWKDEQPFKAVLENDNKSLLAGGEKALIELLMATHAGNTTEEFTQSVKEWLAKATHPATGKPFTEMVFLPMLELLDYLRANDFKTFIVSGGGIEFMRPWTEKIYGIPPEQVIGSSIKTRFEIRNGTPVLTRLPEVNFIDDKAGKPVGIINSVHK